MPIAYQIERLIRFALQKELIGTEDETLSRNALMALFGIDAPYPRDGRLPDESLETAAPILCELLDYCAEKGLIPDNTTTNRDLMDARIMGLLLPRPSEFNAAFFQRYAEDKQAASDYFYALSRDSNYIQVDRINKNLYWRTPTEFGDLEITINLSKPEKDPKEIAAAKSMPQSGYPKCLLCPENEGYAGNMNHPARQNLRLLRLTLNDEPWFMQYSPYVYYNEHCIVLHKEHVPMKTVRASFRRLLDFVDFLPHYFLGSNADIPIVGGSILTHDHYQGGCHDFPMALAKSFARYAHKNYLNIRVSLVKWPLSVIRIAGKDKDGLVSLALFIMEQWKAYSDESADVLAYSDEGQTGHNAVTPIARVNNEGLFELDIVLRNNRTSAEHPFGIFHPHTELHHIKKENIGLIEVMGLAVLPGRLNNELSAIAAFLTGEKPYDAAQLENPAHSLHLHAPWIHTLMEKYGASNEPQKATAILRTEVGLIFSRVLRDAGVFKYNEIGKAQFHRFMTHCQFELI